MQVTSGPVGREKVRYEAPPGSEMEKANFWGKHRETPMTERQRRVVNRLLDAGPDGFTGGLTTRKYAGMTKASRATSYRAIAGLLNKKILVQNAGERAKCELFAELAGRAIKKCCPKVWLIPDWDG